jgi:outer membrane receptor protein involved in Fe transport
VGAQTEVITVVGETQAAINTSTQDIAFNVTEQQIKELPIITRDAYALVGIAGNVSGEDPSGRGANGYAINGMRAASTNLLLDGAANNDEFRATPGQEVPLDAMQEFSVITSNFSAQYGRASGGVVNVATKSGTNTFHGGVYDFFRNDSLSTQTFDEKANELPTSTFDRNVVGFSLGGPIVKDKLHFFVNGEYLRVRSSTNNRALVPTSEFIARAAANTRDFINAFPLRSDLTTGSVITAGEISGVTPGGPFSQLPSSLPIFQQVTWTVPADAGGGAPQDDYQLVTRLDWAISPSASFYLRYAWQDEEWLTGSISTSPYGGFDSPQINKNHNLLGSLTYVFSSSLTSQTKLVYNKLHNEQPLGENPYSPTLFMRTSRTGIGGVNIAFPGYGPFSPGTGIPFGGPQKLLQFYQDMNLVAGRHDVRFGGSFVRIMDDRTFGAYANPAETLGANVGMALDNFLLGYLNRFESAVDPAGKFPGEVVTLPVSQPNFTRNNRYNEWALYVNDTWSVTDRLKLNLGLRYEYFGVQHNTDPSLDSNFYYGSGSNIHEQIRNGRIYTAPESPIGSLWSPDKNNFAPRVGFAWDVTGDGKTSVRGGYGIGYERNFGNVTFNVIQNPPNYATLALVSGVDIPQSQNLITRDLAGPLSGSGSKVLPRTSARHVAQDIVNAHAHFWSLSLQREIFPNNFLEVTYTGSRGVNLYSIEDPNRPGTGTIYLGDAPSFERTNLQYAAMNTRGNKGKSQYHGVNFGWTSRKLGSTGLQFTANYTLGRAKDNLSSTFSESYNNYNLGLLDPFDPDLDYGYADFDIRHRFAFSGIWDIPLARNGSGFAKAVLGDWSLSWIFDAQTGAPFTIFDCENIVNTCPRMLRVAEIGPYTQTPIEGSVNQFTYLDYSNQSAAFGTWADPVLGVGDFGPFPSNMDERNSYRRPGRWNVDAMLAKRFRFGDRAALQLRFEVYNVFNHANLYIVPFTADVSDPTIYAIKGYSPDIPGTYVGDGQRRIQLGAKLEF